MNTLLRFAALVALTVTLIAPAQARTLQLGNVQDAESSNNWQAFSENLLSSQDTFPVGGNLTVGKAGSAFVSTITGTRSGLNEQNHIILRSVPNKTYTIHGITVYSSGGVTNATSLDVEETDGTKIIVWASAALTDDTVVDVSDGTSGTELVDGLQRGRGVMLNLLNEATDNDTTQGSSQIFFNILYSLQ